MSPATMALAYRIWGDCRMYGWSRTAAEIAESLGETESRIRRVAQVKGWSSRLRASGDGHRETPFVTAALDAELESLGGNRRFELMVA